MKKIKTLNEELNRMKSLMNFDISNNSLDYLIENEEVITEQNNLLKVGSKGDGVKALQKILNIKDDGIFGPNTKKALINFQKENKLNPDGVLGPKTMEVINKKFNINEDIDPKTTHGMMDAIATLNKVILNKTITPPKKDDKPSKEKKDGSENKGEKVSAGPGRDGFNADSDGDGVPDYLQLNDPQNKKDKENTDDKSKNSDDKSDEKTTRDAGSGGSEEKEPDNSSETPQGDQIDLDEFDFKIIRKQHKLNKKKYNIQEEDCEKHVRGLYKLLKKGGIPEGKLNEYKNKHKQLIIRADWCVANYRNELLNTKFLNRKDEKLRYIYSVLKEEMPQLASTKKEGQKYTIYRKPKEQVGKIAVITYLGNGRYKFRGGKLLLDTSNKNDIKFNPSYIKPIRSQLGLKDGDVITIQPKLIKRTGKLTTGKFQVS
jgi:hypothetical protein